MGFIQQVPNSVLRQKSDFEVPIVDIREVREISKSLNDDFVSPLQRFFLEKKNTNARKVYLGAWLHSLDYFFGNG